MPVSTNLPKFAEIQVNQMIIKQVENSKGLREFVDFQFRHYRNDRFWVPPLRKDELNILSRDKNPAYAFCEGRFWIASDSSGKSIGRIGAVINKNYNEKTGRKYGRITRIEFVDDPEVSSQLFNTAESWLRDYGMELVHGPLGFTNIDGQGLLIEGFDYLPSVASVHNKSYYKDHFEKNGYAKENDWVEFRLTLAESIPEKAIRLAEVIKKRFGLEVIHFSNTSELTDVSKQIFSLMNKAFDELPYVVPFSDELSEFYIRKYFRVLNPEFVKVIKKEDKILAFILGMPSLSEAMQKANGRLFPFGIKHIMKAIRKPSVVDLMLTGVDPEYQAMGLPAILIAELQQVMIRYGVMQVETTGIFESNQKAIQHWKNYENIQHKRRRCYIKEL